MKAHGIPEGRRRALFGLKEKIMNNKKALKNLVLTALFLAIGLVLPLLTGQIKEIGNMLLPMHLPVFLCAFICGWEYATPMAFVLPVMRSLIFGMPPIYPTALAMAFELAAYAFVAGFIYYKLVKKQNIVTLYVSLIVAMIVGRAVWGVAQFILLSIKGDKFTFAAFLAGAFTKAFPGIIVQLVLIPIIMLALDKANLVKFRNKE